MSNERNLYERLVLTDDQGRLYVYYGKAQAQPDMKIKSVHISQPVEMTGPLKDFVSEVMDKNA